MIPYIIINGVSSKSVNGLLIQNLPAISKPKLRTSIEEIDGRDGDVVTTLGYSAYDKTFDIGLYGDYNVDDVLEFFNTSGKVIFSNEKDKYYNFAIYNQIDLERLVRFKKAKVTMHVQPFKYAATDSPISNDYESGTTSATIKVRNRGNIPSKPTLSITGSGYIYVYLNNLQVFSINLATTTTIIIDVAAMNAQSPAGIYLNRVVTGDYDNFMLKTGVNTIQVSGAITNVTVNNVSRWI